MKKNIITVLFLYCLTTMGQERIIHSFSFPINPTDKEWQQMDSPIERIHAIQIPDSIIRLIPTSDLLELCLDFPYIIDIVFADDYQKGFELLTKEFNGYDEFLNRKDIVDIVLSKLNSLPKDIQSRKSSSKEEIGTFSFRWMLLEILISQECVIKKMDKRQKSNLFNSLKANRTIKELEPHFFNENNLVTEYLIYVRSILNDTEISLKDFHKESLILYSKGPRFLPNELTDDINKYLKMYEY